MKNVCKFRQKCVTVYSVNLFKRAFFYFSDTHVETSASSDIHRSSLLSNNQFLRYVQNDHKYENSTDILRKQLAQRNRKILSLQLRRKIDTQKIRRMKKKIASLKDVVHDLRQRGALSESGITCLESVSECSVSEFLQRFSTNYKLSDGKQIEKRKKVGR